MTGFELLLGHLCGDYLLQNNWMALNKGRADSKGWLACFVHCLTYTVVICAFTVTWTVPWFALVFVSHFLIDKFGVVEWYLHTIKGRSIKDCLLITHGTKLNDHNVLQIAITAFVYIVCDNTLHLVAMFYGGKYLGI